MVAELYDEEQYNNLYYHSSDELMSDLNMRYITFVTNLILATTIRVENIDFLNDFFRHIFLGIDSAIIVVHDRLSHSQTCHIALLEVVKLDFALCRIARKQYWWSPLAVVFRNYGFPRQ